MPKKGWKGLIVRDPTKKLFDKLRGKDSHDEFLSTLLKTYEATQGEPETILQTLDHNLASSNPCDLRFEHEDVYFCGKHAPKTTKLFTLKVCGACRARTSPETKLPKISYYYTCGATEKYDVRAGLMLFCKSPLCPVHLRERWHTTQGCVQARCPQLKRVKTK